MEQICKKKQTEKNNNNNKNQNPGHLVVFKFEI